jgi:hypothetical protein
MFGCLCGRPPASLVLQLSSPILPLVFLFPCTQTSACIPSSATISTDLAAGISVPMYKIASAAPNNSHHASAASFLVMIKKSRASLVQVRGCNLGTFELKVTRQQSMVHILLFMSGHSTCVCLVVMDPNLPRGLHQL